MGRPRAARPRRAPMVRTITLIAIWLSRIRASLMRQQKEKSGPRLANFRPDVGFKLLEEFVDVLERHRGP